MSELTRRLREFQSNHLAVWGFVESRPYGEAADRIDALEECLREILEEPLFLGCESAAKLKARALLEEQ